MGASLEAMLQQRNLEIEETTSGLQQQREQLEAANGEKERLLQQWRTQADELDELNNLTGQFQKQNKLAGARVRVLESRELGYDLLTAKVEICFRIPLYRWRMKASRHSQPRSSQNQEALTNQMRVLEQSLSSKSQSHAKEFSQTIMMASENDHLNRESDDLKAKLGAARILLQSQQQAIEKHEKFHWMMPLLMMKQKAAQLVVWLQFVPSSGGNWRV